MARSGGRRTAAVAAALAVGCALSAAAPGEGTPDAPVLVEETVGPDGSTTSVYDDGSSFTFAPAAGPRASLRTFATLASSRRSRDWSATYAATVTSQYFHHDGGEVRLVLRPFSNCGISQTVYLQVATSWGGYTRAGRASVGCGGGTITWTTPEGNKKFELVDPDTNDAYSPVTASGVVYWND